MNPLVVGLLIYIFVRLISYKIFYRGKFDQDGWQVFNLSIFAEYSLVAIYLTAGVLSLFEPYESSAEWYLWIIPVLWCIYFLMKGLFIFTNRKNYLRIKNNTVEYNKFISGSGGFEKGAFDFGSYAIIQKPSSAPFSSKGWFLQFRGAENEDKIIEFDLGDMGLGGFIFSMGKYLQNSGIKKHAEEDMGLGGFIFSMGKYLLNSVINKHAREENGSK